MNTNHDALREALELLRIFKNNLGPDRASLSAEDAILWDRVEALSQPMPEAAAQGWKPPYVDRADAVNLARNLVEDSHAHVTTKGLETLCEAVLSMDAVLLSASPAAPEGAKPDDSEQELMRALEERDAAEDMADQLAAQIAAITGEEIGEHSSANDPWRNAMLAADEWIAKDIRRLCRDPEPAQPPHPQPQAQSATLRQCANPDSAGPEPQAQGEPEVVAYVLNKENLLGTRLLGYKPDGEDCIELITLQSHREAIAQHRAAMEESVEALRHLSQNARVSGAEMGLALVVAKDAITHANQVLGKEGA